MGEPIALVIAETHEMAEDALEHIRVEIDPLPAIVSCREFAPPPALLVEDEPAPTAPSPIRRRLGDARAEFPGCYVRRERISTNRHTAAPMELRGLLAEWDAQRGHLTVNGAAKVPFTTRRDPVQADRPADSRRST